MLHLLDMKGNVSKGRFDLLHHLSARSLPVADFAQVQLPANFYQAVHLLDEAGLSALDLSLLTLFQCQQLIVNIARDPYKLSLR